MGRASRRKRERSLEAPGQAEATAGQPGKRYARALLRPLAAAAVVLVLILGGWLYYRGYDHVAPETPQRGAVLPDPDTSDMTAPVARAIREARQAALAQPGSGKAVGAFCQVLHAHWLYDEASECYEIARGLAPGNFRWVYLLAGVEDIRGVDGERINQLFIDATRLAPRFPPAYVRRADALLRLGRWSEALEAYSTAVELDPELVLAQRGLGQAAILLGDGPLAIEHLEYAAALSPQDRIVQVALARAYTLVGRADLAAEAAQKAQGFKAEASLPDPVFFEVQSLAVNPVSLRDRLNRSLHKGDYDTAFEAAILLEESGASAAKQQVAEASKQRANQLAFTGDFDNAISEYKRAARYAPEDPEVEHNWGTVLLRRGELEDARRHFERAIALNPGSADSLYNLGVVLEGLGRGDEAITHFSAAAAIDPQHRAVDRLDELGVAVD